MNWWPMFEVQLEMVIHGVKRLKRVTVQAPSMFRAEEFACYCFESDFDVQDLEVVQVDYATP